ncbi:glycosyl transferase group 1 [Sphingobium chlorophenolicum L-1]|uniref:Glycosyl transferase group 1 n=1 Tax=Sphingobium chlorophenolicum L-1 TaxID=690566 RepID=F6F0N1_SPHCR|nr:glycosyltransferase [Sphingobium chlorophenolicum]AEG50353.1 glycosyl transferase group 1 [Sphingobium chlorophenolicum L-1]
MSNTMMFTIAYFNYLPQIAILKQSLEKTHGDFQFTVFLCDEMNDFPPKTLHNTTIIPISSLYIPHFEEMCLKYTILELNTAVKPFVFAYIFEKMSADRAFYLDPDLVAVSRMQECFDLFDQGANIILTPHTLAPIEDELHPNDFDMAKAGIYNLGFCGVARTDEGRKFIGWWCRKLIADCRVDLENGIFVDQKWCDAVPSLYDGVAILRHEGYNVGYWNLMHRPLWKKDDGTLMAGKHVARLLHFSGVDMQNWNSISRHQNRLTAQNLNATTRDAFSAYRYHMMSNGFFDYSIKSQTLPGTRIFERQNDNRAYARELTKLLVSVGRSSRNPSFSDFNSYDLAPAITPNAFYMLPDFFIALRAIRPDVSNVFPDLSNPKDTAGFLEWLENHGLAEMPLEAMDVKKIVTRHRQILAIFSGIGANIIPTFARNVIEKIKQDMNNSDKSEEEKRHDFHNIQRLSYHFLSNIDGDFLSGIDLHHDAIPIPAILYATYKSRSDLISAFDLRDLKGRKSLLDWATNYFHSEYSNHIDISGLLAAITKHGSDWPRAFVSESERSEPKALHAHINSEFWQRAINYGLMNPADYSVFTCADDSGSALAGPATELISLPKLRDVVTLFGYPRAEMGMGEHVRNTAHALSMLDVPFEIVDFNVGLNCGLGNKEMEDFITPVPSGKINLLHINADQTIAAKRILGQSLTRGQYNIGYWAWELERFPEAWREAIDLVDEIWAPSKFIQGTLRQVTDKPVIHMPLRVETSPTHLPDLNRYGIKENSFAFLFFFDFSSFQTRKNPLGVIQAFRDAFPLREGANVTLIIKTIGAQFHPAAARRLHEFLANDPRIITIHKTLPQAEMAGLIEYADCFISLHRSEGFGRGMAEAMAFGRIVIGTGYGGNMDFMSEDTAYLVDYRLAPVPDGAYVESQGSRWAEPDVIHATRLMRHVFDNQTEARQRAQAGKKLIETQHSGVAVAQRLVERIAVLNVLSDGALPSIIAQKRSDAATA